MACLLTGVVSANDSATNPKGKCKGKAEVDYDDDDFVRVRGRHLYYFDFDSIVRRLGDFVFWHGVRLIQAFSLMRLGCGMPAL